MSPAISFADGGLPNLTEHNLALRRALVEAHRLNRGNIFMEVICQALSDADSQGAHLAGRCIDQNNFIIGAAHSLQLRWFSARILPAHYAVNRSFGVVNDIDRLPFWEQQVSKHFHKRGSDKLAEVFEYLRDRKTHHSRCSLNQ